MPLRTPRSELINGTHYLTEEGGRYRYTYDVYGRATLSIPPEYTVLRSGTYDSNCSPTEAQDVIARDEGVFYWRIEITDMQELVTTRDVLNTTLILSLALLLLLVILVL